MSVKYPADSYVPLHSHYLFSYHVSMQLPQAGFDPPPLELQLHTEWEAAMLTAKPPRLDPLKMFVLQTKLDDCKLLNGSQLVRLNLYEKAFFTSTLLCSNIEILNCPYRG